MSDQLQDMLKVKLKKTNFPVGFLFYQSVWVRFLSQYRLLHNY